MKLMLNHALQHLRAKNNIVAFYCQALFPDGFAGSRACSRRSISGLISLLSDSYLLFVYVKFYLTNYLRYATLNIAITKSCALI